MLVYCFAWQHIALRISTCAVSPYAAERRNLMVDLFAGGVWPVAMAFNVLPSVLLLAALAMNNFATGGARLFRKGLVAHLAGAGAALVLVGLKFEPESSFRTVLWCDGQATTCCAPLPSRPAPRCAAPTPRDAGAARIPRHLPPKQRARSGPAAARLRERVAAAVVMTPGGQPLTFTVSIRLTEHVPPESVEALIERADRAMYQAKTQGRDRVTTLPEATQMA